MNGRGGHCGFSVRNEQFEELSERVKRLGSVGKQGILK